jgi:uncharacterized protein YukE
MSFNMSRPSPIPDPDILKKLLAHLDREQAALVRKRTIGSNDDVGPRKRQRIGATSFFPSIKQEFDDATPSISSSSEQELDEALQKSYHALKKSNEALRKSNDALRESDEAMQNITILTLSSSIQQDFAEASRLSNEAMRMYNEALRKSNVALRKSVEALEKRKEDEERKKKDEMERKRKRKVEEIEKWRRGVEQHRQPNFQNLWQTLQQLQKIGQVQIKREDE